MDEPDVMDRRPSDRCELRPPADDNRNRLPSYSSASSSYLSRCSVRALRFVVFGLLLMLTMVVVCEVFRRGRGNERLQEVRTTFGDVIRCFGESRQQFEADSAGIGYAKRHEDSADRLEDSADRHEDSADRHEDSADLHDRRQSEADSAGISYANRNDDSAEQHDLGHRAKASANRRKRKRDELNRSPAESGQRFGEVDGAGEEEKEESRPLETPTKSSRDSRLPSTSLHDFKMAVVQATSYDEIRAIIRQNGLDCSTAGNGNDDKFRSSSSSSIPRCPNCRRRSVRSVAESSGQSAARSADMTSLHEEEKKKTPSDVQRRRLKRKSRIQALLSSTTCAKRNTSVEGEFGLVETRDQSLNVCGPYVRPIDLLRNRTDKEMAWYARDIEKHKKWTNHVTEHGICRPMEMIINLEPVTSNDHSEFVIVSVKRCRVLLSNGANMMCNATRTARKIVSFKDSDGINFRSYVVSDHLECSPTDGASRNRQRSKTRKGSKETGESKKHSESKEAKGSKKDTKSKTVKIRSNPRGTNVTSAPTKKSSRKSSCPWPFKVKVKGRQCDCQKTKTKGSQGYLAYRACLNIKRGLWSLQDRQAKCVLSGQCWAPVCRRDLRLDQYKRRCVSRHQTTPVVSGGISRDPRPASDSGSRTTDALNTSIQDARSLS